MAFNLNGFNFNQSVVDSQGRVINTWADIINSAVRCPTATLSNPGSLILTNRFQKNIFFLQLPNLSFFLSNFAAMSSVTEIVSEQQVIDGIQDLALQNQVLCYPYSIHILVS
jgi:hypothetical protein